MKKLALFVLTFAAMIAFSSCDKLLAANISTETSVDEYGNEIVIEYMYDPNDDDRIVRKTVYDKDGLIDVSYNYYEDGTYSEETFYADGVRKTCTTYQTDGCKSIDEFGENGKRTCAASYDERGTLRRVDEFYANEKPKALTEYAASGNETRHMEFDENEETVLDRETQYENGIVNETTKYFANGIESKREWLVTDENGGFIEHRAEELYPNGNVKKAISYDENGGILDEASFGENGEPMM